MLILSASSVFVLLAGFSLIIRYLQKLTFLFGMTKKYWIITDCIVCVKDVIKDIAKTKTTCLGCQWRRLLLRRPKMDCC